MGIGIGVLCFERGRETTERPSRLDYESDRQKNYVGSSHMPTIMTARFKIGYKKQSIRKKER